MALPDSLTSRHFHWEVLPRLRIGRQATDATDAADATCSGDARLVLPETAGDSWNGSLAKWAGEMGWRKKGGADSADIGF